MLVIVVAWLTIPSAFQRTTMPKHRSAPEISVRVHSPEPPSAKVDRFVGQWVNENPQTDGINRVEIQHRLNSLEVHVWGRCHPVDCAWGTERTDVSDSDDGVLSITWRKSFMIESQQISILPDGRLQVVGHTRFTDNSGRPEMDSTYYFMRPK